MNGSAIIAAYACIVLVLLFIATSPKYVHWFVLPVIACGILIGTDAVEWCRGRCDLFDPVGIIGVLGFHAFFLAPLLHVFWNYWMAYVEPPTDWREWLGYMAILNALGLLVYRLLRGRFAAKRVVNRCQVQWEISGERFAVIILASLLVTAALQVWTYRQSGGVLGYMRIYTDRYDGGTPAFQGMGWLFMISESFPILAMLAFAVYARKHRSARSWLVLAGVLMAFFITKLLFGGLRGSRSNTIWALFWALGIVHYWLRPVPRKMVVAGMGFLVGFMYLYGFYKESGVEAVAAIQDPEARAEITQNSGRTLPTAVLGDLARSDVQAFLLYRLERPESDYELAWGRTYVGAAALLIPRSIWPDRPVSKVKEGTDAQYGAGTFSRGRFNSSRVYGLAGEAMLNFGPLGVPLSFVALAVCVGFIRKCLSRWRQADSRLLIAPLLVNLCFVALVGDSDNLLFFFIKNGALPLLVIAVSSRRIVTVAERFGEAGSLVAVPSAESLGSRTLAME